MSHGERLCRQPTATLKGKTILYPLKKAALLIKEYVICVVPYTEWSNKETVLLLKMNSQITC